MLLLLSGCRVAPKYQIPVTECPEVWKNEKESVRPLKNSDRWWEVFDDENLNKLEQQALNNNKDLYAAYERVLQARSLAGIAAAETRPQINCDPNYNNEGILYMLYDPIRIEREHRRRNHIPFNLTYEIDLWGKLQKAYESQILNAEAEEEAFNTLVLILTSDLAASYFQLRTYDTDLNVLQQIINSRKRAYGIAKNRYESKIISYSDVTRAEFEYKNTESKYFRTLRLRNIQENKIAVLLGIIPSHFKIEPDSLKQHPPNIPPGLPSEVLLQRPDITEAERVRASEHASLGVAYASFFPSLSLTGALGFSSPELKDFLSWKSRFWAMGANAFQPIYDGGLLKSNLDFAIARFKEADAEYQQQVLKAFQEVEDALADLQGLNDENESLSQALLAVKTAYKISSDRYDRGIISYTDVIDTERQELDSKRILIEILGQKYIATIQLIKALGGRWDAGH